MPEKIASLFKNGNGPHTALISRIKPATETQFGPKHVVTLTKDGVEYDWFVSPETLGKALAGAQAADWIDITKTLTAKGFASYKVQKASEPIANAFAPTGAAKVTQNVYDEREKDREKREAIKQDRISIAGFTQSLITSGKHSVPECKAFAIELVEWSKQEAERMYQEEHMMEV